MVGLATPSWTEARRTCWAYSPGGHLAELERALEGVRFIDRFDVTFAGGRPPTVPPRRTYHVCHPRRSAPRTLLNLLQSLLIVLRERPLLVISSGADVAVPVCILARLSGARLIYIETAGELRPSLTGRLLYPFADLFIVQWPEKLVAFPRAVLARGLLFVILVAVGTFIRGFDALVEGADEAALRLGLAGFAQIGHSKTEPRHLAWERFLPPAGLRARIAAADIVVCHGGIGLVGEAMRAGKLIIIVPRCGSPTRASPAGDQTALARRLAALQPIRVCEQPDGLAAVLEEVLAPDAAAPTYALGSNVPTLIADFLCRSAS